MRMLIMAAMPCKYMQCAFTVAGSKTDEKMRVSSLVLLSLLFLVEVHCQQTFPYVSFLGQTLVNHSYVNLSLVGSEYYGSNSVQCHTDLNTCCSNTEGIHRGDWYFPDGTRLPFFISYFITPFGEVRTAQRVDIHREHSNAQTGIYRCDISTVALHHETNILVRDTVYVGLYFTAGI